MTIRNFKNEDLKQVLDIYNYYIKNTSFSLAIKEYSEDEFYDSVKDIINHYPFLVAEDNNNIIGFSYLSKFNYREAYNISADLTIYFAPDYTHQGYGSTLLNEIVKRAKEMKIENIISLITDCNEISKKFHERNGFIKSGYLANVAYKNNQYQSLTYYLKHL